MISLIKESKIHKFEYRVEHLLIGFLAIGCCSLIFVELHYFFAVCGEHKGGQLAWHHEKIKIHCCSEAQLVLLGRDDSWNFTTANTLYPCFKVLVPCVLPHKI